MEICVKVGSSRYPTDPLFEKCPRDGHIVAYQADGHKWSRTERKKFLVLRLTGKFEDLEKDADSTFLESDVMQMYKYTSMYNSSSGFMWEYKGDLYKYRGDLNRKYFIDFKQLLNSKLISQTQYDQIYNYDHDCGIITLDKTIDQIVLDEQTETRLDEQKNMAYASGTFYVGTGSVSGYDDEYSVLETCLDDMDTTLTGNYTIEHDDESTVFTSNSMITTDPDGNTITLKPKSGCKHSGKYGNATHQGGDGARITCTNRYRYIMCNDNMGDSNIGQITVEDMVFGGYSYCLYSRDGNECNWTAQRNIIFGTSGTASGASIATYSSYADFNIFNNIIYDNTESDALYLDKQYCSGTVNIFNNTMINCERGVYLKDDGNATFNVKNNLVQDSGTADYTGTSDYDSHAYNISEDATSPDGGTYQLTLNTDNFENYTTGASADFQLTSGTNVGVLDDAVDPGTMPDEDIVGEERVTWYIGASEIVSGSTTYTKTTSLDSLLQKEQTKTVSIDALIQEALSKTTSLDALLYKSVPITLSIDALLKAISQSTSTSMDALLQGVQTKEISIDAILKSVGVTTSLSIDAILYQTGSYTRDLSIDALLNKAGNLAQVDLDALLYKTSTVSTSLDAYLVGTITKNLSMDAILLKQDQTKTLVLDAYLEKLQTISTSLDAILIAGGGLSLGLDALLTALDQTKLVSLDALIFKGEVKTVSLDSIVTGTLSHTVDIDALLNQTGQTKTTLLDAIIYSALAIATPKFSFETVLTKSAFATTMTTPDFVTTMEKPSFVYSE